MIPDLPSPVPLKRGGRHRLARLGLWLVGWRPAGTPPPVRRCVVLAVPHTSNWDLVYAMLGIWWFGVPMRWVGKKSLFEGVSGPLMRLLGGMPIDRSDTSGLADGLAARFAAADTLMLGMAPEGTRSRSEHWKSGFYRIARAAQVPVVLAFIDHETRQVGLGPALDLTGDMGADMDRIRAFYAGVTAHHPADFGPIRLRDEGPAAQPPTTEDYQPPPGPP